MGGFNTFAWGGGLWGQGTGASDFDVANALSDAWYRLGFLSAAELATAGMWVSVAELYQFADDEAKKVAYESGVFLVYDESITAVPGAAVYELPASHIYTVMAALISGAGVPQLLRLTPVRDLWALDGNWPTTTGNSVRCSLDAGQVGTLTLYPSPVAGGTLAQICQEFPPTVAVGSTTMALPSVLIDLFSYAMLAGARGKESEGQMADMAAHYQQRVDLYEALVSHLFGPGQ